MLFWCAVTFDGFVRSDEGGRQKFAAGKCSNLVAFKASEGHVRRCNKVTPGRSPQAQGRGKSADGITRQMYLPSTPNGDFNLTVGLGKIDEQISGGPCCMLVTAVPPYLLQDFSGGPCCMLRYGRSPLTN